MTGAPLDPLREASLVVSSLSKTFVSSPRPAVNNISFHVGRGECLGLLGVNGAGKTTTFNMLTGDEVPTTGDARIGSTSLRTDIGKVRRALCGEGGELHQRRQSKGKKRKEGRRSCSPNEKGKEYNNSKKKKRLEKVFYTSILKVFKSQEDEKANEESLLQR